MDVDRLNSKMTEAIAAMNEKPFGDDLQGTTSAAVYLTGCFILAVDEAREGHRFTEAQLRALSTGAVDVFERGLTLYKGWALRVERSIIQGAKTRAIQVHVERAS